MCMAAGIDPPAHVQVHGWLLLGGEKMSNSSVNQISPGELTADFGVDPVRYHLLRDIPLGSDGDFSAEGIVSPLQRRPGQQSRQPAVEGGHRGRLQVRRGSGLPPTRTAAWPVRPAAVVAEASAAWDSAPAPPGTRGHLAAHPGDQRRAGDGRALEGRARARGGRRSWAVPSRCSGSCPSSSSRPCRPPPTRSGGASASTGRRGTSGCRRPARWGGYPGGLAVGKGAPLFPRRKS